MKIGILTYHKSINYGSVLQAWALKHTLLNMGHEVEIIDYEPDAYEELYGLWDKSFTVEAVRKNIFYRPLYPYLSGKKKNFESFRKEHLNLSKEKYKSDSDIMSSLDSYDAIIVGSDQVWNVRAYDCDAVFFLPFEIRGKKIAYGVSVNTMDFTEDRCDDKLRQNILDFDFISSRENSGCEKIKKFVDNGKKVDTVLDPTMLLEREDYDAICTLENSQEPYIFLYDVWANPDIIKAAKTLSDSTGIPVRTLLTTRDRNRVQALTDAGIFVDKKNTSPQSFVSMVKNASYVITDSFHGVSFSLVMEKPFFAVKNNENDERISNVLSLFNLENRYITSENLDGLIDVKIDYEEVTRLRLNMAQESVNWLLTSLNDGDN